MKFSVVCPAYNSSDFILNTLQSVVSQSYRDFEIVIADDGSQDDTAEKVKKFLASYPSIPSKVIACPHRGPGATRNVGILNAVGEWISFLDSDDLWFDNKLAIVAQAIEQSKKANFFCHSEVQIKGDGDKKLLDYSRWYKSGEPLSSQLYMRNLFSTSAVTCARDILLKGNLFDEFLMSGQDYELWLRLSPLIDPHFINEVLGYYYLRKGGITLGSHWPRWKDAVAILLRHRRKVGLLKYIYRLTRHTLSFGVRRFL